MRSVLSSVKKGTGLFFRNGPKRASHKTAGPLFHTVPFFTRVTAAERIPINERSTDAGRSAQVAESLRRACLSARIADDYRSKDTLVLDMTNVTPIVDYFILTTGSSRRQMHAVAEEVDRMLEAEEGSQRIGLEGYESNSWILQDYGDIVLHIFSPEARSLYELERLWADAPPVDWKAYLEHSESTPSS